MNPMPYLIPAPPQLTPVPGDPLPELTVRCVAACPELGIDKRLPCGDRVVCGACGNEMLPVAGPELPPPTE